MLNRKRPKIFENQLNKKTAQENYAEYINERNAKFREEIQKKRNKKIPLISEEEKKQLCEEVEGALADIIKTLDFSK